MLVFGFMLRNNLFLCHGLHFAFLHVFLLSKIWLRSLLVLVRISLLYFCVQYCVVPLVDHLFVHCFLFMMSCCVRNSGLLFDTTLLLSSLIISTGHDCITFSGFELFCVLCETAHFYVELFPLSLLQWFSRKYVEKVLCLTGPDYDQKSFEESTKLKSGICHCLFPCFLTL